MRKLLAILMSAALASGASAAPFADSGESRLTDDLRYYASCIVSIFPRRAVRLLQSEPGSGLEKARLGLFFRTAQGGRYCWPSHETHPVDSARIRGALAEVMYVRYYRSMPDSLLVGGALPIEGEEVAACIVRRDPQAVDSLLRHRPGAAEARQARGDISSSLRVCGGSSEGGDRIPTSLRGFLAETMFLRARGLAE